LRKSSSVTQQDSKLFEHVLTRTEGNYIYEIETEKVYLRYERLKEDGKKPSNLKEIYLSRKLTLHEIRAIFCEKLGVDI
jgi:hypothetical protein